jgi:predicted deacetylase
MWHISLNPWPYGHDRAAVIRDDDVSYFTEPHKLSAIYDNAWKQGFKVSIAAIPKVKAINDPLVPSSHRGKSSLHTLTDNAKLVNYLREKLILQQIDISQHGYTHETVNGLPEFSVSDQNEINERLIAGREILEQSFSIKISVFIPPWDILSKKAGDILRKENMAYCQNEEKKYRRLLSSNASLMKLKNLTQKISFGKRENRSQHINRPYTFRWHNYSLSLNGIKHKMHTLNGEEFREGFPKTVPNAGLICILNHYHSYYEDYKGEVNPKRLSSFCSTLDLLSSRDVWKTTLTEVADWLKKLKGIELKVIGEKLILTSPVKVYGVTIKGKGCNLASSGNVDVEVKHEKNSNLLICKQLEAGKTEVACIE